MADGVRHNSIANILCVFQKIIASGDQDKNDGLDLNEFSRYLKEHEKKLRLTFKSLDKNNDGMVSLHGSSKIYGFEKTMPRITSGPLLFHF